MGYIIFVFGITYKIEIGVHTDTRGKKEKNLELSACRAKSIADCLINDFKISKDRISFKGYGSSQLLVSESEKLKCAHCYEKLAANRRVEVKLVEVQ